MSKLMLQYLKSVSVRGHPLLPGARAVVALMNELERPKYPLSNPDCKVFLEFTSSTAPQECIIEYDDGVVKKYDLTKVSAAAVWKDVYKIQYHKDVVRTLAELKDPSKQDTKPDIEEKVTKKPGKKK
jgi:hypothetical protein